MVGIPHILVSYMYILEYSIVNSHLSFDPPPGPDPTRPISPYFAHVATCATCATDLGRLRLSQRKTVVYLQTTVKPSGAQNRGESLRFSL